MTDTFHPSSRRPLMDALTKMAEDYKCRGKIAGQPPLPKAKVKFGHNEILVIQTMMGDAEGAHLNLELGADANFQVNKNTISRLAKAFDRLYKTNMANTLVEYGAEPTPPKKRGPTKTTG